MKTLSQSLNESLNESKFKEHKNVRIGDKGEDYLDEEGIVLDKGIGIKALQTAEQKYHIEGYDSSEVKSDWKTFVNKKSELDTFEWVIVEMTSDGSKLFYVYDDSGFLVRK